MEMVWSHGVALSHWQGTHKGKGTGHKVSYNMASCTWLEAGDTTGYWVLSTGYSGAQTLWYKEANTSLGYITQGVEPAGRLLLLFLSLQIL